MRKMAIVLPVLLAACGSHTGPGQNAKNSDEPVKLELASPDQAVKTWWKVRDQLASFGSDTCSQRSDEYIKSRAYKAGAAVTTGAARKSFDQKATCDAPTFSREIIKVEVESDTRAIVLAKIKATTPIPSGATVTDDEKRYRQDGFPYKYLLEKVGSEWKVAQIYAYKSYNTNDPWEATFDDQPKPFVHAYVAGVQ